MSTGKTKGKKKGGEEFDYLSHRWLPTTSVRKRESLNITGEVIVKLQGSERSLDCDWIPGVASLYNMRS